MTGALCVLIGVVTLQARAAAAADFRYGHISWERVAPGAREVRFTVTQAWAGRSDERLLPVRFGDGSVGLGPATIVARDTDGAGVPFVIQRYEVTHAYEGDGPYLAELSSCCRAEAARNSARSELKVEAMVDLRDGTNTSSPVALSPHAVRLPVGGVQMQRLSVVDPDGRGFTCRLASASESEILDPPGAPSSLFTVSPSCVLSVDTSGVRPGDAYAVQVIVQTDDGPIPDTTRVAVDFLVEVGGTGASSAEAMRPGAAGDSAPGGANRFGGVPLGIVGPASRR